MTHLHQRNFFGVFLVLLTLGFSFTTIPGINDLKFRSHHLDLSIKGTSSLHDWEIKSDKGQIDASILLDSKKKLTGLSGLTFSVPAESLKSGHKAMDKNTYKALNTAEVKTIRFSLTSAKIIPLTAVTYQIKALGTLSIAGTSKETDLLANATYNPTNESFTITCTKKFKMSEYKVKPPTVMMGTIKTGDDISITFQTMIIK